MCEVANAIIITLNVHSSLIMITFHFFCPIPFYSSSPSAFPFHTVGIYRTEGGGWGRREFLPYHHNNSNHYFIFGNQFNIEAVIMWKSDKNPSEFKLQYYLSLWNWKYNNK